MWNLRYADDITLTATSKEELEKLASVVDTHIEFCSGNQLRKDKYDGSELNRPSMEL